MTKEHQLAWAAGFVGGEGCIHISRCTNRRGGKAWTNYQLILHVSQKTKKSLARLADLFQCGSLGIELRKGLPYWKWRVTGTAALETLEALLPYLFEKKEMAENAIEFQKYLELKRETMTRGTKGSGYSNEDKDLFQAYHEQSKTLNQRVELIQ